MPWNSVFTLVAGGFVLGVGLSGYVLGRTGNRVDPKLSVAQILLAGAILAIPILPAGPWSAALGMALSLGGLATFFSALRPGQ